MQKRCEGIEAAVRQAVQHCERAGTARAALSRKINGEIKELMEKRRAAKLKNVPHKQDIKDIQKQIQKHVRKDFRIKCRERIRQVLRDFSDLKQITGIRSGGKKQHLMTMTNEKGDTVSGREEIADVFATFYEELYNTRRTERT